YQGTAMAVGQARVKHKVMPPATTGPEPFECALRVQQNTLEQLVFFLPVFWLAALMASETWASLLGFIWVGGRVAYGVGYRLAPGQRGPGFGISFLSSIVGRFLRLFTIHYVARQTFPYCGFRHGHPASPGDHCRHQRRQPHRGAAAQRLRRCAFALHR
ncbi:MAG: MAPEG family protein, partial [Vulcanococcus sp.]